MAFPSTPLITVPGNLDRSLFVSQFTGDAEVESAAGMGQGHNEDLLLSNLKYSFTLLDFAKLRAGIISLLDDSGFDITAFNQFDELDSESFFKKVNATLDAGVV